MAIPAHFVAKHCAHWESAPTPLQKLGVDVPFWASSQMSAHPPADSKVWHAHSWHDVPLAAVHAPVDVSHVSPVAQSLSLSQDTATGGGSGTHVPASPANLVVQVAVRILRTARRAAIGTAVVARIRLPGRAAVAVAIAAAARCRCENIAIPIVVRIRFMSSPVALRARGYRRRRRMIARAATTPAKGMPQGPSGDPLVPIEQPPLFLLEAGVVPSCDAAVTPWLAK